MAASYHSRPPTLFSHVARTARRRSVCYRIGPRGSAACLPLAGVGADFPARIVSWQAVNPATLHCRARIRDDGSLYNSRTEGPSRRARWFLVKLIIWDLDDTLWRGTLAEGDEVELSARRAHLIRALNRHGVMSSICSKNEFEPARAKLIDLGLWDEFVFPKIAFHPKPQAIVELLADMQLRPADTLFIDDNPINLHEAKFVLPELNVLDITAPGSDEALEAILATQPASRNRVAEYRRLERKKQDRVAVATASDEEFLHACEIRACPVAMMANLDFVDRITELVNRSNQLNYTRSRIDGDTLRGEMTSGYLDYYCWSIFVEDRYGDHGLVGFVMIERASHQLRHFVFSCRVMHMGIENYALRMVRQFYPGVVVPGEWRQRFGWSEAEWVTERSYEDPETRRSLFASHGPEVTAKPQLRIMCACQSGGLAHYSDARKEIEFDIWPRLFDLKRFAGQMDTGEDLPPYLAYGAGTDYKDEAWAELAHLLDQGLYQTCLQRMCDAIQKRGINLLVLLPPENLPAHLYGPEGLTRERTIRYNALWRSAVQQYPCVTTLDVQGICSPEDMVDVNHHRPAALETVAKWVDIWYSHVKAIPAAAA
jgi:FkbH-like protein